jgi:hypothetical protein
MKKVAATSGQSVSLATLFFAVGIAREGSWAGSDIELNFYSRPPNRNSLAPVTVLRSPLKMKRVAFEGYKTRHCMQEENAPERKYFLSPCRTFGQRERPS